MNSAKHLVGLLAIAAVSFAIGGGLFWVRQNTVRRTQEAQSWIETECTIDVAEWNTSSDGDRYFAMTFLYEYQGKEYASDRLHLMIGDAGDTSGFYRRLRQDHPIGSKAVCYVNPNDPSDAVFDREYALEGLRTLTVLSTIFLGVSGLFVFIMGFPVLVTGARWIARSSPQAPAPNRDAEERFQRTSWFRAMVFILAQPHQNVAAWGFFLGFTFVSAIVMDGRGIVADWLPNRVTNEAPAKVVHVAPQPGHEFGKGIFKYTFTYEVDGQSMLSTSQSAGQLYDVGDTATVEYDVANPSEAKLSDTRKREVPSWVAFIFGVPALLLGFGLLASPFHNWKKLRDRRFSAFDNNAGPPQERVELPDYICSNDRESLATDCVFALIPVGGVLLTIGMFWFF